MHNRLSGALVAALAFCIIPAAAQNSAPKPTPNKPNFTGLWQAFGTADWDIQAHGAEAGPFYQLGAIGSIPPGQSIVAGDEIPYLPKALEQKKQNLANRFKLDPVVKCYMPGVPRANYMAFPFQIIQSDKDILIAYEFGSENRLINMGKPQPAVTDTWMGTSNGHWDGNTLVVDVTGFNGMAWFDRAGNFASDALHVVERYSLLDPNTMNYEATIEDPQTFSRPWKVNVILYKHREKDARLLEFKCVEFTEELIYGDLRKKAGK
ncbi:MAG TPA: hypothetical protein VG297_17445 [Bryobacteraceae bacterium]|jgi:hypothetical protein|nr:hypothetical protein [Bryobacteraceae bacterium]